MLQMRGGNMKASFPSQALPCSGSTGFISALPLLARHPEES
jgi:hypothetical protein